MKPRLSLTKTGFVLAMIFCAADFVYADGLSWSQNDWNGGSGQSSWSDATKFSTSSSVSTTADGVFLPTTNNWYDTAWKYRQSVAATNNSGSTLSGYQIPIYLNTYQLIGDGKMKSDCSDIKILDTNGNVLPFWIATAPTADTCNHTATKIWIKLSSLTTSGDTLSLYYGNTDAVAASNGNNVFSTFADFTTGSSLPTGWTKTDVGSSGSAFVGGGVLTMSNTNGEDVWYRAYGATHVYSTSTITGSFIAEALLNSQTGAETWAKTGITVQNNVSASTENGQAFIIATPGNGTAFQYQSSTGESCIGGCLAPNEQTNSVSVISFPLFLKLTKNTSNQVSGYFSSNGSSWTQRGSTVTPDGISDTQYTTLIVTPHTLTGTSTSTYSFFYVRNYVASEPTVGTPQSEQTVYTTLGNLTSSIFDTDGLPYFSNLSYTATTPTNTTVAIKIRTSENSDMSGATDFGSCDPIDSATDISSTDCVTDGQRYIQYQTLLTSSDGLYSPTLESINIGYTLTATYTLSYTAGANGSVSGSSTQIVYSGYNGSAVTATPNNGYHFENWSDSSTDNPRTDTDVTANISVSAVFSSNGSGFIPPSVPKVLVDPSFNGDNINSLIENVFQMAISEREDFSGSSWQPYDDSYKTSQKTIYIKFRSEDGGESKVYTIHPTVKEQKVVIASSKYQFKNNLKQGMNGQDVKELQKFLNKNGYEIDTTGFGSPGKESTYFGKLTTKALIKFQKANNISPAIGYFGPITRGLINSKIK